MKKAVLDYNVYLDKVEGCWLGKSLAGVIGAPYEAQKIFEDLGHENLWPKVIYPNDDLDIQIVWLEMLEELGTDVTYDGLIKYWQDRCWYNFAEYGYFLYNVQRGVYPPVSGDFNNSFFRESEGCPIRAEIWGLIAPNNPVLAAGYAYLDGTLDHIKTSVHAEMFWAAANAYALVCNDLDEIVNAALSVLPEDNEIERIVSDVRYVVFNCSSLKEMWINLIRLWGDRDSSKSQINFAFSLLPLYYGLLDFKKTMACACSLTFDTDCTAGTACSLLGTIIGAKAIPKDWMDKLGKELTCDVNVRHKGCLISDFAKDTVAVGAEAVINKNNCVDIINLPDDILKLAKDRFNSRPAADLIEIESASDGEILSSQEPDVFYMPVIIRNKSFQSISGLIKAAAVNKDGHMRTEPISDYAITVPANGYYETMIVVNFDVTDRIIWDKNLVEISFKTNNRTYSKICGILGSRVWNVYGPYWDAYDTNKFDVCPFRNSEINEHPCRVGLGTAIFHQWVDLDNQYLNEKELLEDEIPMEYPFRLDLAEDLIRKEDISHNMGESCYYFTRELVARETRDIVFMIGATGPFKMWIDSFEVFKNYDSMPYCPQDYNIGFSVEAGRTYRIIIKALQTSDDFKLSISPVMNPIPESKDYGKSFILDTFGNRY